MLGPQQAAVQVSPPHSRVEDVANGSWRGIDNDDFHQTGQRRQRLRKIGHPHGLQRHVNVACQIGIDRHEITFTCELNAEAGEVDDGNRIRARGHHLTEKLAKRFSQRRLIEVARAGDGKSRPLSVSEPPSPHRWPR
jgi:hypothetical protein